MYKDFILIIDDDKDFADSISDILIAEGYETIVTYNAEDAKEILKRHNIRVIISDIKLDKDVDGAELISELKDIRKYIYVILITAYSDLDSAIRGIKNGVYDYLKKPIEPDILISAVRRALHLADTEDELRKYNKGLEELIQKRTKDLSKSNSLLQTITDNIPIGIWYINEFGESVFFNNMFCEITNAKCDLEDLFSWQKPFLQDDLDKNLFEDLLEDALSGNYGCKELRIRVNKEIKWVNLKYAPLINEGKLEGSIGVLNDITKKKILEHGIRELKEQI